MSKTTRERPRLGRGLSSLMSTGAVPTPELNAPPTIISSEISDANTVLHTAPWAKAPFEAPLTSITPNPHQPRKAFAEESLKELAASLRSTGLIQPIVVRQVGVGYELIAGERRWRAAKLAGLESVQVIVREVDAYTQAQMALVENIQRENLNPLDRAAAYQVLMTQLGVTQAELANRLGEDRSSIANHLRLLELAPPVRDWVAGNHLSLGHAKVLASIADLAEQIRVAQLCVDQGLSVRNLERIVANNADPVKHPKVVSVSPHVQDVEKSLARQLGMRVELKQQGGKGKGRLVIHYASLDQFDDLIQRMNVKLD